MPNAQNNKWTLDLSHEADEDLVDIWDYLASEASEEVANRQLHQFDAAFEKLQSWPYLGRKRDELSAGLRSVPVHQYIVFYRIHADVIEVARILHGRRDFASILANPKQRSDI
jgi:toxin ParE1/3/4